MLLIIRRFQNHIIISWYQISFKICQIYDYSHEPRDSPDRISLRLFEETIRVHSRNFIGETKNKYGRNGRGL